MAKRKPGKYDHLFPRLQKLPPADLEYQQRVEDQKKEIRRCTHCDGDAQCTYCDNTRRRTLTGQTLAAEYVIARADVAEIEALLSAANLQLEAVSQMVIASQESGQADWGAFDASDRALKMTDGDTLRLQPEIYPVAAEKDKFREWCYAHELRNRMELPIKPMVDLIKTRLLNGESEPAGMKVYVRTKIIYTPFKSDAPTTHDTLLTEDVF